MLQLGNNKVNSIYEENLDCMNNNNPTITKPNVLSDRKTKERFICDKYVKKVFVKRNIEDANQNTLNKVN